MNDEESESEVVLNATVNENNYQEYTPEIIAKIKSK